VKLLSDACARDPDLLERFFAEARSVNLIRHENIVNVLDLARLDDGRPYIVMEFVEGRTLGSVLGAGRVPLGGIVQVMDEVLSALGAAHAIGIVHRDLNPENILVTAEGHAKVLDFGIAKLAPDLHHSPRTRTGALLGTPSLMAPEQISGRSAIDARTDIYAAGVVLFEAVCGAVPFQGEVLFDLMRAHVEQPPPAPRLLRPELSIAFEAVILTALAKDPAARYQSAAEMAHALANAALGLPDEQRQALSTRSGKLLPPGSGSGSSPRPYDRNQIGQRATLPAQTVASVARPGRARRRLAVMLGLGALAFGITIVVVMVAGRERGGTVASLEAMVASSAPPKAPPSARSPSTPPTTATSTPPTTPPSTPTPTTTPQAPPPSPKPAPPTIERPPSKVEPPPAPAVAPVEPVAVAPPVAPPAAGPASHPADYDPKHFDPVAYLPAAQKLARTVMPDAFLISFEFDPVFSDGHVELSGRDHEYRFRSPARSKRPADRPANIKIELPCIVHVEVTAKEISAVIRESDTCSERLIHHPHCTFAQLMTRAKADKIMTDNIVARVGWLFDEKWFFDTDPDTLGKGGGVHSLDDHCP
jgi:serine/threonine-protein kinase